MAGLFVFHIAYVRIHLLTETHLDDLHATQAQVVGHDDGHEDGDQHKPHPVSDHLMQMASKQEASLVAAPVVASETLVSLTRPDLPVARVRCESWKLPGESPPDPRQPRAPPLG
jgi:4'-phosphopantetheinyl transferase EntD